MPLTLVVKRPDGVEVVTVATPNDSHFSIASAFLRKGISVVCEKPLTQDSATAAELVEIAKASGAILAVPHCYSAYAMVRHAARMVLDGELRADGIAVLLISSEIEEIVRNSTRVVILRDAKSLS